MAQFTDALDDFRRARDFLLDPAVASSLVAAGFDAALISEDMDRLQRLHNADALKKEADTQLSEGSLELALEKYDAALNDVDVHVGCWSNRAACKMAQGHWEGCIEDCTTALRLLGCINEAGETVVLPSTSSVSVEDPLSTSVNMLSAVLPPRGGDKHKLWILKTIVRRAKAYVSLGQLENAVIDFGIACALEPSDQALRSDMAKLKNLQASKQV